MSVPLPAAVHTFSIPMRTRFRGITHREGMVWRGSAGWAEWSPFLDYGPGEIGPWLAAAHEAAELGWPEPVRDRVPVNVTVPVVGAHEAHRIVASSACTTAKAKVADPRSDPGDDIARLEAVRDALGPSGRLRIDANGAWDVDTARARIRELARFDLEYVEQPCPTTEDLAALRRALARDGVDVPIAADESIRRSGDPERVVALEAADVAVIKVQPLGGVRACLGLAERLGLPVVVSSALETSIGLSAGLALAAALPELPYACGLNTSRLLAGDLVTEPLEAVDGHLRVHCPEPTPALLGQWAAEEPRVAAWRHRWREVVAHRPM